MHRDMFTAAAGARAGVPWLGVVITDGVSTFDSNLTIPEADIAKNKNIMMFAIGELSSHRAVYDVIISQEFRNYESDES